MIFFHFILAKAFFRAYKIIFDAYFLKFYISTWIIGVPLG